jgi:predicted amidohydrolase
MNKDQLNIAAVQLAVADGGKSANLARAVELVREAEGADLVILPELWNIGFLSFDQYISEAEDQDGPTLASLRDLARELNAYLHTGSFVEKDQDRFYNSSYLLSPKGEILANYRKVHLFGYESEEPQILTPGDRLTVADVPFGKVGLATCYDLRFPEMFRKMVDMGVELFLVCSAWPSPRLEHWIMLNRVRALENQAILVAANSVGESRGGTFVGHSMIVDPWGVVLVSGGDQEGVITASIDLAEVGRARAKFPVLSDRVDWLNAT